jgi:hypothetical protein
MIIRSLFIYNKIEKNRMYKVIDEEGHVRGKSKDLTIAMEMAKLIDEFVIITDGTIEIVGKFGVDSIVDGKCPDGIAYDWNKESRIGRVKKERV